MVPLHETSHLQAELQSTLPHAGSVPMHVALHAPVPQVSVPHAALPPEHVSMQLPVVHITAPHAALPSHVAVQSPLVQVIVPHAALPLPPEHVTLQSPVVHEMSPHAALPVHVAVQLLVAHVMSPQEPALPHMMVQFQPAGQLRLPLPVPTIVHDFVAKLHVPPQMSGHTAASSGLGGASTSGRSPITQ